MLVLPPVPMMSRDVSFRPPMCSGSSEDVAAFLSQLTIVSSTFVTSVSSVIIRLVPPSRRR